MYFFRLCEINKVLLFIKISVLLLLLFYYYYYYYYYTLTTVMTRTVVDNSTDHAKPHFNLFFLQNINVKENGFYRARLKKALLNSLTRANAVWTLINNCKLANQIARLVAIVVKTLINSVRQIVYNELWKCKATSLQILAIFISLVFFFFKENNLWKNFSSSEILGYLFLDCLNKI